MARSEDAHHRQDAAPRPILHARVVLLEAPVDLDGLPALDMTYVGDGDVAPIAKISVPAPE